MRLETVLPGTWYGYRVSGSVWVWCVGLWPVCLCTVRHLCVSPSTPNLRKTMQYYKVLSVPGISGVAQYTGTQGPEPTLP